MTDRKSEKRTLGRGLSALMADLQVDTPASTESAAAAGLGARTVPVEHLRANPLQPRRSFPAEALADLAASIRQKGILQPLIVRAVEDSEMFEIVAGERRWRAAQLAGLAALPVLVRTLNDTEVLEIGIIENIQRSDLNGIEEADAYQQLMDRFGHTQEQMAEALSRSRSHIANMLRLLKLPDAVKDHVREGRLSSGHARALVTSDNAKALARKIIDEGLSVREAEALVRNDAIRKGKPGRSGGQPGRTPHEKDADTKAIEADLSANLGMAVSIYHEPGGERGRITITYNTLRDLDDLCRGLSMLPRGD